MAVIPGAMDAGLVNPVFWLSMMLALTVAFFAAWPVNRHLLARGKGHASRGTLGDRSRGRRREWRAALGPSSRGRTVPGLVDLSDASGVDEAIQGP